MLCEHTIHLLLEKIYTSWRKRKVASLLMLDVSGAFDNVSHERLIHNMRKRGLPIEITDWIASYLTDRKTRIKLMRESATSSTSQQGSRKGRRSHRFYTCSITQT